MFNHHHKIRKEDTEAIKDFCLYNAEVSHIYRALAKNANDMGSKHFANFLETVSSNHSFKENARIESMLQDFYNYELILEPNYNTINFTFNNIQQILNCAIEYEETRLKILNATIQVIKFDLESTLFFRYFLDLYSETETFVQNLKKLLTESETTTQHEFDNEVIKNFILNKFKID